MMYRYALSVLAAASTVAASTSTTQIFFGGSIDGTLYGSVVSQGPSTSVVNVTCMNAATTTSSAAAQTTGSAAQTTGFDDGDVGCPFDSLELTLGHDLLLFSTMTEGLNEAVSCTWTGTTGTATCSVSMSDASDGASVQTSTFPPSNVTLANVLITAGATSASTTSHSSTTSGGSSKSGATGGSTGGSTASTQAASSSHNVAGHMITMAPGLAVAGGMMLGALAL